MLLLQCEAKDKGLAGPLVAGGSTVTPLHTISRPISVVGTWAHINTEAEHGEAQIILSVGREHSKHAQPIPWCVVGQDDEQHVHLQMMKFVGGIFLT